MQNTAAELLREWKAHLKRSPAGNRLHSNVAAVLLHDSINRIEPQSRALADWLGREERLEDAILELGRDSGAVVADFHQNASELRCGADYQFALPVHRVDGVVDQVRPDLIELAAVRTD